MTPDIEPHGNTVTNASRHWVHGELRRPNKSSISESEVTNASRHWVHGEHRLHEHIPSQPPSHKCLSALGSWGTELYDSERAALDDVSQMPLGIGFMGNSIGSCVACYQLGRHKCLSALGSWGTRHPGYRIYAPARWSQMPLGIGFMGNMNIIIPSLEIVNESQMPLGIGFMGNASR